MPGSIKTYSRGGFQHLAGLVSATFRKPRHQNPNLCSIDLKRPGFSTGRMIVISANHPGHGVRPKLPQPLRISYWSAQAGKPTLWLWAVSRVARQVTVAALKAAADALPLSHQWRVLVRLDA